MPAAAKKKTPAKRGATQQNVGKKQIEKAHLQRQAVALRANGHSYREIGESLGCAHTWARTLVNEAVRENISEGVEEMRLLEGQRLDRLQARLNTIIAGENIMQAIAAANSLIRLMDRRAKLFGLDAAIAIDVEQSITHEGAVLVIEGQNRDEYLKSLQQAKGPRAIPA
jgi:hypothetical protein